jgi:enoyl-CoA hydratase/carnithine racemase
MIKTVQIDNPALRNSLDDATRRKLLSDLQAAVESSARVIILRGRDGTFCAGAELHSILVDDFDYLKLRLSEMQSIVRTMRRANQIVIAAVDGYAVGSGLALAAASDLVVSATSAKFGATFGRVGLTGDTGIFWSLPNRIGMARSRRMLLLAEMIGGDEAGRLGLADLVTSSEEVHGAALKWASQLTELSPSALGATKRLLNNRAGTFEQGLFNELAEQIVLLSAPDFREGREAFTAGRKPIFGSP